MLYSSLTQDDQLKLVSDFKRRYAVTVKFWRGSQAHILQRVLSETRGGRFEFDVLETNAPQIEALAREQLLQKMNSPYVEQELLPEVMPPHGEWAPDRLNLLVYAYNTRLVKAAPVDWFILPPAVVLPSAVAVSRRAPHPGAAALFYDYMLTDGQRFYTEVHRVPANKNYDTPVRRLVRERQAVRIVDARETIDDYEKWLDLYKRIIVDRSQH